MAKRLKSCLEALENRVLDATQRGTVLGEATVRSLPPSPFTLRYFHSLCPPFTTLNRHQCTEFPPTHSRVLTLLLSLSHYHSLSLSPSLSLSLIHSSFSSINACMTIFWYLLNLGFYFLSPTRYPSRRLFLSIVFLAHYYLQVDSYRHATVS